MKLGGEIYAREGNTHSLILLLVPLLPKMPICPHHKYRHNENRNVCGVTCFAYQHCWYVFCTEESIEYYLHAEYHGENGKVLQHNKPTGKCEAENHCHGLVSRC